MRRELVQLSTAVKELPDNLADWYCSEKLDGIRAIWIPETRGLDIDQVSWANRERDKRNYVCSGLWSRYAKPIVAPDWWLDSLPIVDFALDGELWMGRGLFQETISITRSHRKDEDWKQVKLYGFDLVSAPAFHTAGQFKVANGFQHKFAGLLSSAVQMRFQDAYQVLKSLSGDSYSVLKQTVLTTEKEFQKRLSEIIEHGGEGLILRKANSCWYPKRMATSLKYKPFYDAEAYVIGTTPGKRGIGALTVQWTNEKGEKLVFDIGTGFTDAERMEQPAYWIGRLITFRYLNLTDRGVPSKAHYHRHYSE